MLSALLFSQDRVASRTMEVLALESQEICIYRTMLTFPTPYELTRLMHTFTPDVALVQMTRLEAALVLARGLRVVRPEAAVIGFGVALEPEEELRAREAGVTEMLPLPLTCRELQSVVEQASRKARPSVQDHLFAFLPAKAGSGSTTVAANLAGALARDLRQQVLVVEADLRSGLLAALLRLESEYSVTDALDNAGRLDGTLWTRLVTRAHGLDFLPALRSRPTRVFNWSDYHLLLLFARSRYDTVVVDLPEVVNDATAEIVRRARVFVVCTAELPSLLLARQRARDLAARGIPAERVEFILNRWNRHDTNVEQLEEFLERPVTTSFHNDYQSVHRAIQEGRLVGSRSELGRSFSRFAREMAGPPEPHHSFFESLLARKKPHKPSPLEPAEVEAAVDVEHLTR